MHPQNSAIHMYISAYLWLTCGLWILHDCITIYFQFIDKNTPSDESYLEAKRVIVCNIMVNNGLAKIILLSSTLFIYKSMLQTLANDKSRIYTMHLFVYKLWVKIVYLPYISHQ